jgi:protein arginine kinase
MAERFLLNEQMVTHPIASGVLLNNFQSRGIRINSKNHFEFFTIDNGIFNSIEIRDLFADALELSNLYKYAYSEDFGYHTPLLENCGTALSIEYYLRLPGYIFLSKTAELREIAHKYRLALLPFSLSEKNFLGSAIFCLRNARSLGLTSSELIDSYSEALNLLANYELEYRQEFLEKTRAAIVDRVMKNVGMLKYAKSIDGTEMGNSFFILLLAAELKLLPITIENVLRTYFSVGNAYIELSVEQDPELSPQEIRVKKIQNLLQNI